MKLLLTSEGISNQSIVNSLLDLTERPFRELKVAFIPTAANIEEGDKGWLIDELNDINKLGFAEVDIVDPGALPEDKWKKRLEYADVLVVSGGDTYYLIDQFEKLGLAKLLPGLLKTKVYVGISAGAMILTPSLALSVHKDLYREKGDKSTEGLGLVNFQIRAHLNSQHFPEIREEVLKEKAKETSDLIYAIDDQSAIKVDGNEVSVVSEGQWLKFN